MKLYPYKQGSRSASELAKALGIKRLKREGKPFNRKHTIINWGSSKFDRLVDGDILNHPENVILASNKLTTLSLFSQAGVACPEWTESHEHALQWFMGQQTVVVRHKLNGHSGEGIEIVNGTDPDATLPDAPLFTKYIKKDQEYRIHVAGGQVIFQQRKARKKEVPDEEVNWQVRNLAGGFIFANHDVAAGPLVCKIAIDAVQALGLDFGAVDIITDKVGGAFALEVNTAPGLMGKTLEAYVNYFQQFGV